MKRGRGQYAKARIAWNLARNNRNLVVVRDEQTSTCNLKSVLPAKLKSLIDSNCQSCAGLFSGKPERSRVKPCVSVVDGTPKAFALGQVEVWKIRLDGAARLHRELLHHRAVVLTK